MKSSFRNTESTFRNSRELAGKPRERPMQYLRRQRFFVLAATHGEHHFFLPIEDGGEGERIRDCRKVPIKFGSYAVSYRGGHAHVRIEREFFKDLQAYLLMNALRSGDWLEAQIRALP